jgi:phospholipid N-methyltransferase
MPTSSLADNLSFLRALLARPKNVGALLPSGPALARAIAQQVDPSRDGPVLELGPGTGVIWWFSLVRLRHRTSECALHQWRVERAPQ